MWRKRLETESNGCIIKLAFDGPEGQLCFSEVFRLLRDNAEFRTFFNGA
jgi:hypothetical protein